MVLYRKEWQQALERLEAIPKPLIELRTLRERLRVELGRNSRDPMIMYITDYQTDWLWSRCRLKTLHSRPRQRA